MGEILPEKPPLYHASPMPIQGGTLVPGPQKTCVHDQFKGTPEESQHQGQFLFAGQSLSAAYAYAFKTGEMSNCGVHALANGDHVTIAIVSDKDKFLDKLSSGELQPTIYRLPESSNFTQVHDRQGKPMGEWISREKVPLSECQTVQVHSLEEAMEKGVQIFFLKDGMTKGNWHDIVQAASKYIKEQTTPQKEPELAPASDFQSVFCALNEERAHTDQPNWTLEKLAKNPHIVQQLAQALEKEGLEKIPAERMDGHMALVVPLPHKRVLRIADAATEPKNAGNWQHWQPLAERQVAGFNISVEPKVPTLAQALQSGEVSKEEAAGLIRQAIVTCAFKNEFLWDCKPENFAVVKNGGMHTLFVLDAGAVTPMEKMHEAIGGNCHHTKLEWFSKTTSATLGALGQPDELICANPQGYLLKLSAEVKPQQVDYEGIQKSYAASQGLAHGRIQPLPSSNDNMASQNNLYFKFLECMVNAGVLEHYNMKQQICPLDLDKGAFMPTHKPSHFADKVIRLAIGQLGLEQLQPAGRPLA